MRNIFIIIISISIFIFSCNSHDSLNVQSGRPILIKERFVSTDKYEIICYGYPKEGLEGIQRQESAKRAAILNAYYFAKQKFNDSVKPDMDGKVEKYTVTNDYVIVNYIIAKKDLKSKISK